MKIASYETIMVHVTRNENGSFFTNKKKDQ